MGDTQSKNSSELLDNEINLILNEHKRPRTVARFFAARGIVSKDIGQFLNPRLAGLSDPYRFPGIKDAAKRLWQAINNQEHILIHGDYDTDGITASALLSLVLRQNGGVVKSFLPQRFYDGYGFTPESLDKAIIAYGSCKVLVTVDCGITSCDAIKSAKALGIDVIVTDHHEPGGELPEALAVINPKVCPELDDLQVLSGVGVAFKLSHAFVKYGRENNLGAFNTRLEDVLDYVALGTVADIVPLLGENRIMVHHGIEILRRQYRPGVRALIEGARLQNELTPADITFKLAPRINAAGRVGDAITALELLESDNIVEAYGFANQLENYNRERQTKEQEIYQEAKQKIDNDPEMAGRYSILVAGHNWHQGVIGIVASRLARDYNRPAIVLTIQEHQAYGSGRSIGDLNLVDILSKTSHLLERYGGHPMAVGIGLQEARIDEFYELLENCVREKLIRKDLTEYTCYDGEATLREMNGEFFDYLEKLAPFGHSNSKPLYRFNDLSVLKCFSVGGRHTRGALQAADGSVMDFIA
ncbi:MAG: single-stranded-DNA-specific exonuclease RecJ, partial [Victivallaceae bacterium]